MEVLQRESEELRETISKQDSEIKTLTNKIILYERRWEFFGQEKSCVITIPVSGKPDVELDGNWTLGFARRAHLALVEKVRLQLVANRLRIEREQKNREPKPENADSNQTEADNPPEALQTAMAGGQGKEVTDE